MIVVVGDSYCMNYVADCNNKLSAIKNVWLTQNRPLKDLSPNLSEWKYMEPFPIWPDIISKHLNLPLINLSQQGLGNSAIYSKALDIIVSDNDIKKLIVVWSGTERISYEQPGGWWKRYDETYLDGKIQKGIDVPIKGLLNDYLRYIYSLQEICKSKNIDVLMCQSVNIVIYDKWSIELGNHLLDSPYYKKIDRSIFPDFPGHTDLDGKCFIDVMSKDNNNEKSVLNKIDQHPNEFGNKLIAEYVKGLL